MSQENVEIIRRALEAFRANDVDAWLATISPDPYMLAALESWATGTAIDPSTRRPRAA